MKSNIANLPAIEARAISISLVVSVVLLSIKFAAYFVTNSAAIFSDAVESIANVMGSFMAFYALILAHTPADEGHPYGHGKIEFLSAMFEGGMVLLAAVFIFIRTLDTVGHGELVQEQQLDLGLALVIFALIVNGIAGLYLIRTGMKQGSMTLEADGKHLLSDAITSVAVLVALSLVKLTGWPYFDPITAMLLGVYIAWMAIGLMRRSGARLMDRQDPEDMRLLKDLLDAHVGPAGVEPRICAYHKLRHRHTGRAHWVDFHIQVPAAWTIKHAHEVAGAIEGKMERALGEANATAHVEPCPTEDCAWCERTEK